MCQLVYFLHPYSVIFSPLSHDTTRQAPASFRIGLSPWEETRTRIVLTALKLFGEHGFDGASTRDIATTAAGVNALALQYYSTARRACLACVEHIVDRVWEHLGGVGAQAEKVLKSKADDDALIEAFCAIQMSTAEFMFTSQEASDWRLFMARQQGRRRPARGILSCCSNACTCRCAR